MLDGGSSEAWSVPSDLLSGFGEPDFTLDLTNPGRITIELSDAMLNTSDQVLRDESEGSPLDRFFNALEFGGTVTLPSLTVRIIASPREQAFDDEPLLDSQV